MTEAQKAAQKRYRDRHRGEIAARDKKFRAEHPDRRQRYVDASRARMVHVHIEGKECSVCHAWKSREHFGPVKYRKDGLRHMCKPCRAAQVRAVNAVNPAQKERERRWREQNRDKANAKSKDWGKRNRPKVRDKERRYRENFPERARAKASARYNRKAKARSTGVRVAEWLAILDSYCGLCVYCQRSHQGVTMDHITPLNGGGLHQPDNVVPACGSCNCSKQDTPLLLWLVQRAA